MNEHQMAAQMQMQQAMDAITGQVNGMFSAQLNMVTLAASLAQMPNNKEFLENLWAEYEVQVTELERDYKDGMGNQVPTDQVLDVRNMVGEAVGRGSRSAREMFDRLIELVDQMTPYEHSRDPGM